MSMRKEGLARHALEPPLSLESHSSIPWALRSHTRTPAATPFFIQARRNGYRPPPKYRHRTEQKSSSTTAIIPLGLAPSLRPPIKHDAIGFGRTLRKARPFFLWIPT